MADVTTVVDGNVKFREGKKWKTRWCVLKKSSPVADHLQLVLYKDVSDACKPGAKPKSTFTLDSFFGLKAAICVDREQHVLAIVCLKNVFLMAFELRESMICFEIKIRQSLGEEHQFPVKIVKAPSSIKLPKDQISLMIHDTKFCFAAQTPPKILQSWNIQDLRRFGAIDDKFIFEGGARCGKGSGLYAIQSDQADDIADVINLASLGKMSNTHHKFNNRRRGSSTLSISSSEPKEINSSFIPYTTITLSVPLPQALKDCRDYTGDDQESSQQSSPTPVLDTSSLNGERVSPNLPLNCEKNNEDCVSPAKTVLRPRAGREYIVLKRIPMNSCLCPHAPNNGLQSQSSSLSRVSNSELLSESCSNHCQNNLHHEPCRFHHCSHHYNHPASSCASLSICSHLSAQLTPQRSPSCSTTVRTARSHQSLVHDMDVDGSNHLSCTTCANVKKWPVESSSTVVLSSPSLTPRTPSSSCRKDLDSCPSVLEEENNIFFPVNMTFHTSSPSPQLSHRFGVCESNPIYVNQQFVDMHYSQNHNFGSRTVSSSSSHSVSSPWHAPSHSRFQKDSHPKSKNYSESNSLGRNVRMRSRHSESDTASCMWAAGKKYSKSFCLPSNHRSNLTMPASVCRSHSDPKRPDKNGEGGHPNVNQKGIHGKEFDKFAKSSIIARRRLKHAELIGTSEGTVDGEEADPLSPSTQLNMSSSEPALSLLQISPLKSSGYKNIDLIAAAQTPTLNNNSSNVSHLENIVESQCTTSSDFQLERNNDNNIDDRLYSPHHHHSDQTIPSISPPPLPLRQRLVSTPSTISPPLTPYPPSSDHSDSPPPYNAPPPPDCMSDTSSSHDDQELNYIVVDMTTTLPAEKQQPVLPISISRTRSKRARQQKKLNKLRYAEIDHTATKALQHTGQMHAQTRNSGILSKSGSSLSRMNSAPMSKSHKQFRERKPSTGSIESF